MEFFRNFSFKLKTSRAKYFSAFFLIAVSTLLVSGTIVASDPPTISGIKIEEVEEDEAVIKWQTDRPADSLVNYGLDRNYGQIRDPVADKEEHEIKLDNLLPGMTYHLRVMSRDENGNQAVSSDYSFTTPGSADPVDATPSEAVEQALKEVEDIEEMQEIKETVEERVREVSEDLSIIAVPEVYPDEETALVNWKTNRPASSLIEFEEGDSFDPDSPSFSRTQNGEDGEVTEHEIEISGLDPATKYHFRAVSTDAAGIEAKSAVGEFETDAISPAIRDLELVGTGEDFAIFEWSTSVPAESMIEYENLETEEVGSQGSPTLSSNHSVRLSDLDYGVSYSAKVMAIGEDGGVEESQPIEFETVIDDDPPEVSNVSTESTLFPGADTKVQTIVSWKTNKKAVCYFNYQEGLAPGADKYELEPRDDSFLTEHVQVVVDFRQATVYQFWFVCEDRFGNEGESEKFVVFTPQQEKNIIDIIMENFEESFGWVEDIMN
ncbi:MAG: fibronectin type III domain-containing protein [Candidatus Paceibacterota bacterium]